MNWLNFRSLRNRYAILTVLIGFILLSASWLAQNKISQIKTGIKHNIDSRIFLTQKNRHIHDELWQLHNMLTRFQLDPKQFNRTDFLNNGLSRSLQHMEELLNHPWIKNNYHQIVSELITNIHEFDNITQQLIRLRLKPTALYPSLEISSGIMQPINHDFTDKINLAITELENNHSADHQAEYSLLVQLRYQWIQMISDYRMYMINRMNSFREAFLATQTEKINERYRIILEKINSLNKLKQDKELEINTAVALETMARSASDWDKNYKKVLRLHHSGEWRTDIALYQNELEPKLEKITRLLRELDLAVDKFSNNDFHLLSQNAQNQVNLLWIETATGLLLLLTGYIFLKKLILNPIATVTKALKNESKGIETLHLNNVSIEETNNLIDAFSEMRMQIHTRQQELEYHALHDNLTGLANRNLLKERMQQAIHNAKQDRASFSVLIMDLDRFKEVNDTLGHQFGDKLLRLVGLRLLETLREVDLVSRLGGDEFAILLNNATAERARQITKKILHNFESVFIVNDIPLYIDISIGISIFPQHGYTHQTLMQRADIAMYVAKRNKTGYEIYDEQLDTHSVGKLSLISDIRNAIDNHELLIKYQPIINLKTGKVVSAEALLRWNHPQYGEISPDELIPIAEQTGMINPITHWIIDSVARYHSELKSNGIEIKIAINLSVYNLQENNFAEKIISTLEKNGISSDKFSMEVTESSMMVNPNKSIEVLNKLNKLGVEIAVDDYGTGYSSLAYLKRLPLSKLKIDKSFVMDMIEDDNDAMIVRSTIDLAHNLGMNVIAEGIEEKESLELLTILGCELGQGYLFSPPVTGKNFIKWVIEHDKKALHL